MQICTNANREEIFSGESVFKQIVEHIFGGGPFEGIEGKIVNVRGARKKRILVSIPDIIAAIVEVEPEYVKIS